MGDGSGHALSHGEGVAAHKVCSGRIGVIQCVEKERRRGCEQVPDVLLQCVNVVSRRVFRHKAIVVNGVDILVALSNLHACNRTFEFQIQAGASERVEDFQSCSFLLAVHSPCSQSSGRPSPCRRWPTPCPPAASQYHSYCAAHSQNHLAHQLCGPRARPCARLQLLNQRMVHLARGAFSSAVCTGCKAKGSQHIHRRACTSGKCIPVEQLQRFP